MMTLGLQIILLMFAAVGFAGTGASLAVARQRVWAEGRHDTGMLGVAGMLFCFGSLCTAVATGFSGIFAFGGVVLWASYVLTAQRLDIFQIQAGPLQESPAEGPRQTT